MPTRLTNARLSDLLFLQAENEEGHRRRALERAGRAAMFSWPEEASAVAEAGGSLTDLRGVGPWVAHIITDWLEDPPSVLDAAPEESPLRRGFLTRAEVDTASRSRADLRTRLRGDLQSHTTFTDGKNTLREMADEAAHLGHSYLAVTDHSKTLPIARGMDEDGFRAQAQEIADVGPTRSSPAWDSGSCMGSR